MITMSTNSAEFISGLDKIGAGIRAKIAARVKEIVFYIDMKAHARTPVFTGQAVRNMIWATGSANGTTHEAIASPPETGHTSMMGLGEEPRRAANTEAARATLLALDFKDPLKAYCLANQSPDIGLIEDGSAGIPGKSRAPSGVFAITIAEVMAKLSSGAPLI
jgi:hypothetical protein